MRPIPVAEPDLSGKETEYVVDAIKNEGRVSSSGKYLDRFEEYCREEFGRSYALSCSNGTTALHLALLALGIGAGDEVIVPSLTFVSPASMTVYAGATPVFVDVREDTWTIDENKLDAARTERTKAVIAVDLYGVPAQYAALESWCNKHSIFLIEDAAEAHGARLDGNPVGSFGIISTFSFYGNKIVTTGEGGVCLTNDKDLYEKMRIFKNHGMKQAGLYENEVIGFNYRLTNVQAAIGCAQFERLAFFLKRRRENAALYRDYLTGLPLRFQEYDPSQIEFASWFFNILLEDATQRTKIIDALAHAGIETRTFFKPLHLHKAFANYSDGVQCPVSEKLGASGLSLPMSTLLSEEEIAYISKELRRIFS